MLEFKNVTKSFKDGNQTIEAVKPTSLKFNKNELIAIIGPSGSGKSTLSKILAGHPSYLIDGGEIKYCGENLIEKEIDQRLEKIKSNNKSHKLSQKILNFLNQATMPEQ